jgi:hypothetical protein
MPARYLPGGSRLLLTSNIMSITLTVAVHYLEPSAQYINRIDTKPYCVISLIYFLMFQRIARLQGSGCNGAQSIGLGKHVPSGVLVQ